MKNEDGAPFSVSWHSDTNSGWSKDYKTKRGALKYAKRLSDMQHIHRVVLLDCNLNGLEVIKHS